MFGKCSSNLIYMLFSAFRIDPLVGGCVNNGFQQDDTCGCLVEDYNLVGEHCSLGMYKYPSPLQHNTTHHTHQERWKSSN